MLPISSSPNLASARIDGPLIKMLRNRHLAHIRSAIDVFNADERLELSLLETLEAHQTQDFVEAFKTFLAWLQNPYAFYADKMHLAIVERDVETLTTLLIMRAEDGHMPMVRKMYKKRWVNDVVDDLKDSFKGNIGKILTTAAKMTKMLTPTSHKQQSTRSLLSGAGSSLDAGSSTGGAAAAVQPTPSPVEDKIVEVPSTPFAEVDAGKGEEEEKEKEEEEEKEEENEEAKEEEAKEEEVAVDTAAAEKSDDAGAHADGEVEAAAAAEAPEEGAEEEATEAEQNVKQIEAGSDRTDEPETDAEANAAAAATESNATEEVAATGPSAAEASADAAAAPNGVDMENAVSEKSAKS